MEASVKIWKNFHRKWFNTMSFDHVLSSKYGDFIQKNHSHREIKDFPWVFPAFWMNLLPKSPISYTSYRLQSCQNSLDWDVSLYIDNLWSFWILEVHGVFSMFLILLQSKSYWFDGFKPSKTMCCSSFRAHQIIIAFLWLKQNFTHDTSKQMIYIYISPFTTFFTNFITISPMILLCPLNFGKIGDWEPPLASITLAFIPMRGVIPYNVLRQFI